jgi:carbonic anhydrase
MYWIRGRKLELSIENTLLIFKTLLKPIWTYGITLWGTACNPNIEILQRYRNKVLRAIVNSPWCISNKVLHTDLKVPTIREEIKKFSVKYRDKITTHPKELASTKLEKKSLED